MEQRTESRIEGWESKPLTGGFAELRELADGGFSGVARTGTTTLYMLNGRVVGVFGGGIEEFDGTDATVYQAPHPSLPLLFAMQEYGGEPQAKNYTKDTPISAARDQLRDAGFTGYIELSENVLSGDYYVVFYGGRAMSCAFVGNSGRLETGDEAFRLADDEVGIYEVVSVDVEVTDIPDPSGATGGGTGRPSGAAGGSAAGGGQPTDASGGGAGTAEPEGPGAGTQDAGGGTQDPGGGDHAGADPTGANHEDVDASPGGQQAGGAGQQSTGAAGPGDEAAAATSDPEEPPAGDGSRTRTPAETVDEDPAGAQEPPGGRGQADPGGEAAGPQEHERGEAGQTDATDGAPATADAEAGAAEPREPSVDADEPSTDAGEPAGQQPTGQSGASTPAADAGSDADDAAAERATGPAPREEAAADRAVEAASGPQGSAATGAATAGEGVPKSEAAFGDLRPVPSLSPDQTRVAEPGEEAATRTEDSGGAGGSAATASGSAGDATDAGGTSGATTGGERSVGSDRPTTGGGTDVTERASQAVDVDVDTDDGPEPVPEDADVEELRRQLAAREERIEELETAITDLRVQRDGLTDERDRLASEVERLEAEVADLEDEVDRLRAELADDTEERQRLSREDALAGTNLFVRYGSKSGGTLEKAHAGEVEREEVNENLRLEHHTQFEADDVQVEDRPYDQFLHDTIYRGFVEWVVRDLLYEIQDTGHVKQLRELYDAIPQIDRAELLGDVSVQFTEDGEQYREQRSFDVVLRDRMGNPLIVANINDSRNPADREMMQTVIENGIDVKESNESLSSAMLVTASFFKPGALEAADEAHGGSLLGRDSKESYVKLNRKSGYHLILVESRDDDFHVNVPEL